MTKTQGSWLKISRLLLNLKVGLKPESLWTIDLKKNVDDIRGGDISIRFWKDLRQGVLEIAPGASVGVEDKIQVEWPLALLLVRKE